MKKIDDLTFYSMYCVLQSGMWLLNDLEACLRTYEMSQARLSILLAITESEDGVISPNEIAIITGKSRPAITRTIEKLSEQGYLSIHKNIQDGRRKRLVLTGKGQNLLDQIIPEYNNRLLQISSGFSNEEKGQLIQLISKLNFLDKDKKIRDLQ